MPIHRGREHRGLRVLPRILRPSQGYSDKSDSRVWASAGLVRVCQGRMEAVRHGTNNYSSVHSGIYCTENLWTT